MVSNDTLAFHPIKMEISLFKFNKLSLANTKGNINISNDVTQPQGYANLTAGLIIYLRTLSAVTFET